MKVQFPLSWHLYHLKGSQAADQWPQGADGDEFAVFVKGADRLGTRAEEELLEPNHGLNFLTLSLTSFQALIFRSQLLASDQKMTDSSTRQKKT